MEKLAQRLKRLRKAANLTQPQLAKATGVPGSTIAEIETSVTQNPTFETLKKLAAFFDVNEEWLNSGKGQQHTVSSMRDEESELLLLFRALSNPGKDYVLSSLRDLHANERRSHSGPQSPPDDRAGDTRRGKPKH